MLRASAAAAGGAVLAALALASTMAGGPLAVGGAIGAAGAVLAAGLFVLRLPLAVRVAGLAAVAWAVPAAAARSVSGPFAVPSELATFLTLTWPAAGLDGLPTAPACLASATGTAAAWCASRRSPAGVAASIVAGFVAGAVTAGPAGVPWWSVVIGMAAVGVALAAGVRDRDADLPSLPTASATAPRGTGRTSTLRWYAAAVLVPAIALGTCALVTPTAGAFDVRRYVHTATVALDDDNPLATVARIIDDPLPNTTDPDVEVAVDGPSPGRLRLAVLDTYGPEGWHQAAEYARTGTRLPAPVVAPTDLGERTKVSVHQLPGSTGLRATPTGGEPTRVDAPGGVRFAATGAVFMSADAGDVSYEAIPAEEAPSVIAQPNAGGIDAALVACPASPVVDTVAAGITAGALDPVQRLRAIESYLKFRRIYDPGAPGGQTIGSIERFVAQDFARGNLETFVTAFALLARCADVPVRVVVGYPAPAADATTSYAGTDLTAWVETPLAAAGWVPFDPVPTPEEQERQARAAQEPPPSADERPPTEEVPERAVSPRSPEGSGFAWARAGSVAASVLALVALWTVGLPLVTRLRRRRISDAGARTIAAWTTATERLVDRRVPLALHMTPRECARTARDDDAVPLEVTAPLWALAGLSDLARYGGGYITAEHAGEAWAHERAVAAALPRSWRAVLGPLRSPRRALRRLRRTGAEPC